MDRLGLFDAFGVELEYMLVDADSLDVRPRADRLIERLAGKTACDVELGKITLSNELTNHVVEFKSSGPATDLRDLPYRFAKSIARIEPVLAELQLRLLPTGMHPWMNPESETELWPHEYAEIYRSYHRIFDCHRHGWANVQSVHLNLPFADDEEFGRLHAAARLLLPILPALAASSPIESRRNTGISDTRLLHYFSHCDRVPAMMGDVIPEPIFAEAEYRRRVFAPIAAAIAPLDPEGVMDVEFLNARACIARFDRGSIEIRVMDVQEYPAADVAICAAAVALLRDLVGERWSAFPGQKGVSGGSLRSLLEATARSAEGAWIEDRNYLGQFGVEAPLTAGDLWRHLLADLRRRDQVLDDLFEPLDVILEHGTLSTRIRNAVGADAAAESDPQRLWETYGRLAHCLRDSESFLP